jgi:hypothetical protein
MLRCNVGYTVRTGQKNYGKNCSKIVFIVYLYSSFQFYYSLFARGRRRVVHLNSMYKNYLTYCSCIHISWDLIPTLKNAVCGSENSNALLKHSSLKSFWMREKFQFGFLHVSVNLATQTVSVIGRCVRNNIIGGHVVVHVFRHASRSNHYEDVLSIGVFFFI